MLGPIIGDIAGSRFERHNCRSKDFELLHAACRPTDDTVMTLAVCRALLAFGGNCDLEHAAVRSMQAFGSRYPHAGYGGRFRRWLHAEDPQFPAGNASRVRSAFPGREVPDPARKQGGGS